MDWQPIETARKDGSRIWTNRGEAKWDVDQYSITPRPYWRLATFGVPRVTEDRARQPTHWMLLPPPPA